MSAPPTTEKPVPLEREHGKAGQLQKSNRVNGKAQALAPAKSSGQSGQNVRRVNVAEAMAKEYGVSERTIRRCGKMFEAVEKLALTDPELAAKVISGEKRFRDAFPAPKRPKAKTNWQEGLHGITQAQKAVLIEELRPLVRVFIEIGGVMADSQRKGSK